MFFEVSWFGHVLHVWWGAIFVLIFVHLVGFIPYHAVSHPGFNQLRLFVLLNHRIWGHPVVGSGAHSVCPYPPFIVFLSS